MFWTDNIRRAMNESNLQDKHCQDNKMDEQPGDWSVLTDPIKLIKE
jgi:hypothetical protein